MSTALYRRYRSRTFGDLVGQDVIATTLRNEVRAGSLAHAYLFTGIRGTGKTSTARILARAVNCLQPEDGEPCNECSACRDILDGSSVDVLEIDAASNRGIDEMRELRERVKYLPAALQRKVYIIDEAHMLTTEACNAFLKTLEEPPPHVLFVLATTEPHKVPETVRSRVQRFDFRRVSATDITAHLTRILASEGAAAEPGALALLARASQGSVRDALSMLDQALAGGERPLTAANVRRALGAADPATLHLLLEALAGGDGAAALRAVAIAFDVGTDPRQLLREASRLARAAEFAALGHGSGGDVDGEEADLAATLARVAPAGFWLRALELLQAAELELRQPVDARLQVEFCVMRLVRETGLADAQVAALEARVATLERRSAGPGAQTAARQPPAARVSGARGAVAAPVSSSRGDVAGIVAALPPGAPGSATATTATSASSAPGEVAAIVPAAALGAPEAVEPAAVADSEGEAAGLPAAATAATGPAGAAPMADGDSAPPPDYGAALPSAARGGTAFASVQSWQEHWGTLLEAVNRRDRPLAGVLRDCRAVAADATSLTIGAPYNFHREKLQERTRLASLTEAATEVAGSPRTIETVYVGEGSAPGRRPGATGEATQAVLDTFAGSRVTSTRLRDDTNRPSRGGAA